MPKEEIATMSQGTLVNVSAKGKPRRFMVEHDHGRTVEGYYCPVKDADSIKSVYILRSAIIDVAERPEVAA